MKRRIKREKGERKRRTLPRVEIKELWKQKYKNIKTRKEFRGNEGQNGSKGNE